ncbi:hypothetical protein HK102_007788 [Quaeritorhiza haematococci]|nr:hypothetical protein HK102_007788 [Quaeritorhiza haematococci]
MSYCAAESSGTHLPVQSITCLRDWLGQFLAQSRGSVKKQPPQTEIWPGKRQEGVNVGIGVGDVVVLFLGVGEVCSVVVVAEGLIGEEVGAGEDGILESTISVAVAVAGMVTLGDEDLALFCVEVVEFARSVVVRMDETVMTAGEEVGGVSAVGEGALLGEVSIAVVTAEVVDTGLGGMVMLALCCDDDTGEVSRLVRRLVDDGSTVRVERVSAVGEGRFDDIIGEIPTSVVLTDNGLEAGWLEVLGLDAISELGWVVATTEGEDESTNVEEINLTKDGSTVELLMCVVNIEFDIALEVSVVVTVTSSEELKSTSDVGEGANDENTFTVVTVEVVVLSTRTAFEGDGSTGSVLEVFSGRYMLRELSSDGYTEGSVCEFPISVVVAAGAEDAIEMLTLLCTDGLRRVVVNSVPDGMLRDATLEGADIVELIELGVCEIIPEEGSVLALPTPELVSNASLEVEGSSLVIVGIEPDQAEECRPAYFWKPP